MRYLTMWGGTCWLKADETGVWWARRTPEGPATVRVVRRDQRLEAGGWGPGADWLLEQVPELLGLERPGVEDVPDVHPLVRELKRRFAGLRVGRSGEVYPRLVSAALAQKVTVASSKPAVFGLARRFGEPAPGPREDLLLLPDPRRLSRLPYYRLHALNVERKRAELIARIASRSVALERATSMPPEQARQHLEKLRGVGPWTSGVVVSGPLGDPDAVPLADWHLPNIVAWNLAGEPRGDDARMLELLEPFRPFRATVARVLKSSGNKAPRYGARMPVRDIRET